MPTDTPTAEWEPVQSGVEPPAQSSTPKSESVNVADWEPVADDLKSSSQWEPIQEPTSAIPEFRAATGDTSKPNWIERSWHKITGGISDLGTNISERGTEAAKAMRENSLGKNKEAGATDIFGLLGGISALTKPSPGELSREQKSKEAKLGPGFVQSLNASEQRKREIGDASGSEQLFGSDKSPLQLPLWSHGQEIGKGGALGTLAMPITKEDETVDVPVLPGGNIKLSTLKAVYQPFARVWNMVASPGGLMTAGLGSEAGLAKEGTQALEAASAVRPAEVAATSIFTKDMTEGAIQQVADLPKVLSDPNKTAAQKFSAAADTAFSVGFSYLAVHHLSDQVRSIASDSSLTNDQKIDAISKDEGKSHDEVAKEVGNASEESAKNVEARIQEAKPAPAFDATTAEPMPEPAKTSISDYERYQELQGRMREILENSQKTGEPIDTSEFRSVWRESEDIKNRNPEQAGMPPSKPAEEVPKGNPLPENAIVTPIVHPSTGEVIDHQIDIPGEPGGPPRFPGSNEPFPKFSGSLEDAKAAGYDVSSIENRPSIPSADQKLQSSLGEIKPEKGPSLIDRIRERFASPEPVGIVKNPEFVKLLSGVQEGVKNIVSEIRDAPEFTPFKRVINRWNGQNQIDSMIAEQHFDKLKTLIPEEKTGNAINLWIEAGGDTAKLQQWNDESSSATFKDASKKALELTPEQQEVASNLKEFYQTKLAEGQAMGVFDEGVENYVNRRIKQPSVLGKIIGGSGKLMRSPKAALERSFETSFDAIKAGKELETLDIRKLAPIYSYELAKSINTRKLIADLTKEKAEDGRPVAAVIGSVKNLPDEKGEDAILIRPSSKGESTSDYRTINNPALSNWKWVGEENGKPMLQLGQLGIHPDYYAHVRDMLGRSALKDWMDKPSGPMLGAVKASVQALESAGKMAKATSLGFLSPFHVLTETEHAVLGHHVNPFKLPELDPHNSSVVDSAQHGLQIGGDTVAMSHFMDGLDANFNLMRRVPLLGQWSQDFTNWTFHEYIPRLKLATYEKLLAENVKTFAKKLGDGQVSVDDLKYLTARQTNAAYGELNYADMGRNPTMQHIAQLLLLAPDFLEARSRFGGQAIKGLVGQAGRNSLKAIASIAAIQFIASRIANKLSDDDYHWDDPFGIHHGNRRYSLRTIPSDIEDLMKDWRTFIGNRSSPLLSGVNEIRTGKNYRGESVEYPEMFKDLVSKFIPISIRMAPGVRNLTETQKNAPTSPWEQFVSSLGIQTKRDTSISKAYKIASKWKEAHGLGQMGTFPVSKYQPLRYALEDKNDERAIDQIKELAKTEPFSKLISGFKRSIKHPFTGTSSTDRQFISSLNEEDKAVVNSAMKERQSILNHFLGLVSKAGAPQESLDSTESE